MISIPVNGFQCTQSIQSIYYSFWAFEPVCTKDDDNNGDDGDDDEVDGQEVGGRVL